MGHCQLRINFGKRCQEVQLPMVFSAAGGLSISMESRPSIQYSSGMLDGFAAMSRRMLVGSGHHEHRVMPCDCGIAAIAPGCSAIFISTFIKIARAKPSMLNFSTSSWKNLDELHVSHCMAALAESCGFNRRKAGPHICKVTYRVAEARVYIQFQTG